MANHKRRRPKNRRSGCLMCKPHKANGFKHEVKIKGLKGKVAIRQSIPTLAEKIEREEPSEFELEYFNKL